LTARVVFWGFDRNGSATVATPRVLRREHRVASRVETVSSYQGTVLVVLRSLWAAFAAPLGWNWALAGVLHSAVSGTPVATPDWPAALNLLLVTYYLYMRRPRREES